MPLIFAACKHSNNRAEERAWSNYYLCRSGTSPSTLPTAIKDAWLAHWHGQLAEANQRLQNLEPSNGDMRLLDIVAAERYLLAVKMGARPQASGWQPQSTSPPLAHLIFHYADFSRAFFVDHKAGWRALRQLTLAAIRLRGISKAPLICCGFLWGHMLIMAGRGSHLGVFLTATCWWLLRRRRSARDGSLEPFMVDLPWAAFPYSLLMSGRLELACRMSERSAAYVSPDPYYQCLQYASGMYAQAYAGRLASADMMAQRWQRVAASGQVQRYRTVSSLVLMVPLALRGYGPLLAAEAKQLEKEFALEPALPLVAAQFFRLQAIIALSGGDFPRVELLLQKAMIEHQKTGSFAVWKLVDQRLLRCARQRQIPEWDTLIQSRFWGFPAAHTRPLGLTLIKLLTALPRAVGESEKYWPEIVGATLQQHLSVESFAVNFDPPASTDLQPCVRVGNHFLTFQVASNERRRAVQRALDAAAPCLLTLNKVLEGQRAEQQRLMDEARLQATMRGAQRLAHDVKAPLAAARRAVHMLQTASENPDGRLTPSPSATLALDLSLARVQQLVDSLLQPGSTSTPPPNNGAPLQLIVQRIICAFESHPNGRRVRWTCQIDPAWRVDMEIAPLCRALENFLINAMEASQDDAEIRVSAQFSAAEQQITLRIRNSIALHARPCRPTIQNSSAGWRGHGRKIAEALLAPAGAQVTQSLEQDGQYLTMILLPAAGEQTDAAALKLPNGPETLTTKELSAAVAPNQVDLPKLVAVIDDNPKRLDAWTRHLAPARVLRYASGEEFLLDFAQRQGGMALHSDWLIFDRWLGRDCRFTGIQLAASIRQEFAGKIIMTGGEKSRVPPPFIDLEIDGDERNIHSLAQQFRRDRAQPSCESLDLGRHAAW